MFKAVFRDKEFMEAIGFSGDANFNPLQYLYETNENKNKTKIKNRTKI